MNTTYFNSVNRYSCLYVVKPGDTLSKVILKFYNFRYGTDGYQRAMKQILADNPTIKDSNVIKISQTINLRAIDSKETSKPLVSGKEQENLELTMKKLSQPEQEIFSLLSVMEEYWGVGSTGTGVTFASMGILLGSQNKGNIALLKQVSEVYQSYKSGKLSKGQYDYRRKQLLEKAARNLGPTEKLLFKGKTAKEAMRITRAKGVRPTAALHGNTQRLSTISKVAARGGTVLTAVNVGMACHQIANAKTNAKKNEILVETAASAVVGVMGGAAISFFIVATPVGWVTALVLGVASSAISYVSGKAALRYYHADYGESDLVTLTGVNKFCS